MPNLGPTELYIVVIIVLMFGAWFHIFRQGGNPLIQVLLALLVVFLPVIGPIGVFLGYRPRDKRKRD